MKITLDQATLAKAVITHLHSVGVQSDILTVEFRYTRVPYTVFAEVELAETQASRPVKTRNVEASPAVIAAEINSLCESLVDPDNLPAEEVSEVDEPRPEMPAAPLFGGST